MKIDLKKVRPLHNMILARRLPDETYLGDGGLLIAPRTRYQRNVKCEVLAVGPGYWKIDHYAPLQVKVGQIVLVQPYSGLPIDELNHPDVILAHEDVVEVIYDGEGV